MPKLAVLLLLGAVGSSVSGPALAGPADQAPDDKGKLESRVVMKFHPRIAPLKAAIFPLLKNKPELVKKAKEVCAPKLFAYYAELHGTIAALQTAVARRQHHNTALCHQLYGGDEPMNDKAMLARALHVRVLSCLLFAVLVTAIAAHTYRFLLFGLGALTSVGLGVCLTVAVAAAGHLAFERVLNGSKALSSAIPLGAVSLMLWGVFQFAQAGGIAMIKQHALPSHSRESYVDGATTEPAPESQPGPFPESDQNLQGLLTDSVTKIFVAADVMLGVLLGTIIRLRTDEKYAAWKQLHPEDPLGPVDE